jgi:glycosyltransferase involved in cell wall biosynthesis
MHAYNRRCLQKLVEKLTPDIVFHADDFYFFPAVRGRHCTVSDTQDDINWSGVDPDFARYFQTYFYQQSQQSQRNYVVSDAAGAGLNRNLSAPVAFTALPNGADFTQIRGVTQAAIERARQKHNLHGKRVVSYIGGPAKFDPDFAARLFNECQRRLPHIQFLIVGNVAPIPFKNVTWTGVVPPELAAVYYNLSDAGVILKDCSDDPFLCNSVPLKIIQYAAARKPVLTSRIEWATKGHFPNIFEPRSTDAAQWCAALERICSTFEWTAEMECIWDQYDWDSICGGLFEDLRRISANHANFRQVAQPVEIAGLEA